MWVFTQPHLQDNRSFLVNLDHYSVIGLEEYVRASNNWFILAGREKEGAKGNSNDKQWVLATAQSRLEAENVLQRIFDGIANAESTLDLRLSAVEAVSESNELPVTEADSE